MLQQIFISATKIHTDIEYTKVQIEDNEVLIDLELCVFSQPQPSKL
jgi:hypothetical protein